MPIKPNELSEIIKDQIKNFEKDVRVLETGKVIAVGDGIVLASGLNNVEYGEIVKFESGILGMALNLEDEIVGIVVLGNDIAIVEGSSIT
ncbi:ATP synthase alpha/beta family, beta-barrel domain protein, partial [Chlamydia psittaci 02DC14]